MLVLILAAGYGTRLEKDLKNDSGGKYSYLLGVPKPLLPIGGKALISRWMDCLRDVNTIGGIMVVTNDHFYEKFTSWSSDWPGVKVVNDGTTSNESRLGAVADIQFCVDMFNITEDLLVIGGDTLFYSDFNLSDVLDAYCECKRNSGAGGHVLCYQCKDPETSKFGILEVNSDNKVTAFLEKPGSDATSSRWACPCFYIIGGDSVPLIREFLELKKDSPLKESDAPGNFIKYLQSRCPIFVSKISGRFDVGGLQSYIECDNHFKSK